jgi:hypothetical protein
MINTVKIVYGGFFVKYRGHTLETVEEILHYLENEGVRNH